MALSPNAFLTVQDVKDYLKIEHNFEDTLIENLINRATDFLEKKVLFRGIKARSYTETYDGEGTAELFLNNYPVTSVTNVSIDGTVLNSTDYEVSKDTGIIRFYGLFPEGSSNVTVTYTAGYDPVPDVYISDCLDVVANLYENRSGNR